MSERIPQGGFACLKQLRAELQQCHADELEQHRDRMLALIDSAIDERIRQNRGRGDTINLLSDAFLGGLKWGTVSSDGELSAEAFGRHSELLTQVGGLDAVGVLYLFYVLESKAVEWIRSLGALAQTTNPKRVGEQCPHIPEGLILNADMALKGDKIKGGRSGGLDSENLKKYHEDRTEWLSNGGKAEESCEHFDVRMGEKYSRSAKTMSKYRQGPRKSPDTSSAGDRAKSA